MQVSKEILKKWAKLKAYGDAGKIATEAEQHPETVRKALRTGEFTNMRLLETMTKFFEGKEKQVDQLTGAK